MSCILSSNLFLAYRLRISSNISKKANIDQRRSFPSCRSQNWCRGVWLTSFLMSHLNEMTDGENNRDDSSLMYETARAGKKKKIGDTKPFERTQSVFKNSDSLLYWHLTALSADSLGKLHLIGLAPSFLGILHYIPFLTADWTWEYSCVFKEPDGIDSQ